MKPRDKVRTTPEARNTRYISMNLQDHHVRHLDEMALAVGLNRNQFCRALWERMTTEDAQRIIRR